MLHVRKHVALVSFLAAFTCSPLQLARAWIPSPCFVTAIHHRPITGASAPLFVTDDNDDEGGAAVRAEQLRSLAAKARLEAERLESSLALEQIAKLEERLEAAEEGSQIEEVQEKIGALKRRLDPNANAQSPPKAPSSPEKSDTNSSPEEEDVDEELKKQIEEFTLALQDFEEYMANRTIVPLTEEDMSAIDEVKEIAEAFEDLFQEEEAEWLKKELSEVFSNFTNGTTFNETDKTLESSFSSLIKGMLSGNVTGEELEVFRAVGGFLSDLKKFLNISLADEIKLSIEEDKRIEELSKEDPNIAEKVELVREKFPSICTRNMPESADVSRFIDEVVLRDPTAFELTSRKPRNVICAYLVEGNNKMEGGDALVAHLEKLTERTDLKDKLQFFWVRVPQDSGEMSDLQAIDAADEAGGDLISAFDNARSPPTLLITGPKLPSPATPWSDALGSNALGITSVAYFATSCFTLADASAHDAVFASPKLFLAILGPQLMHEFGHYLAASIAKVELELPAIIPWPWTGLLGSVTTLKAPPKNANALFDFASAGPIFGMVASVAFLVVGLQLTLAMDQTLLLDLPRLPLETLKQTSLLTSSIVETVMGFDVLMSLDPTSTDVPCHPLTIAGYVGITANALSLLPMLGSSDGGRMSRAVNGDSEFARAIPASAAVIFLLVQGFREWDVSKLLLSYLFCAPVFYEEEEVPCVNDVDKAGGPRYGVFVAATSLAFIALSPAL